MYEKEGILVPFDVPKVEFTVYQHPKIVEDDPYLFPSVAQTPDAMLRKVYPSNRVLFSYLSTINPDVQIGVLLPKGIEGTSKRGKGSKKSMKVTQPKSDHVIVEKEVTKRGEN